MVITRLTSLCDFALFKAKRALILQLFKARVKAGTESKAGSSDGARSETGTGEDSGAGSAKVVE